MKFDEVKQKWIPETDEEQEFFEYAFNKGFKQAAKKVSEPSQSVEEPKTNMFDLEAIQNLIAQTVQANIAPVQEQLTKAQEMQKQALKEKVIARQQTKIPDMYLTLVSGETEQEIKASYDKAVETYQNELKAAGVVTSFGAPTPGQDHTPKATKSFKEMTNAEKIELAKSDPELFKRLKTENK